MGTDAQGRTYLSYVVAVVEETDWIATISINKLPWQERSDITLEVDPDVSLEQLVTFFAELAESLTRLKRHDILPEFADWNGELWESGDTEDLPF